MVGPAEVWAAGDAYEPYIGRWSRPVARELVAWLAVAGRATWLDVGCGTGALSQAILEAADPAVVVGVDPSAGFLAHARDRLGGDVARFAVADARRLPLADARVDAAVSGLVLNFVPDPAAAVAELARVTRPGGRVAAYGWDYAGRMELIRHFWAAAAALDAAAAELDEGRRFGLCRPGPLAGLFRDAGLAQVAGRPIEVPTRFRDFDDYWTPFLGGQGPAPGYAMALDEGRRGPCARRCGPGCRWPPTARSRCWPGPGRSPGPGPADRAGQRRLIWRRPSPSTATERRPASSSSSSPPTRSRRQPWRVRTGGSGWPRRTAATTWARS